jgi:hypothetical protein
VVLCPRGEAIEIVYEMILAGQVPGIDDWLMLYADAGHCSGLAHWINSALETSVILKMSPLNFPATVGEVSLTAEQAEIFRHAAWQALLNTKGTGFSLPLDQSLPSDVLGVKTASADSGRIALIWSKASDQKCGVYGYDIERSDGKKFSTILPKLMDTNVEEDEEYRYKIRARNFAGMLSQTAAEITVKTPPDTVLPSVLTVTAPNATQFQLFFSEPVDESDIKRTDNYTISSGIKVLRAEFGDSIGNLVILTTNELKAKEKYTLNVRNLRDRSKNNNMMNPAAIDVRCEPPEWTKLNRVDWDGTVIDLKGDNLLITAKGGYMRAPIFKLPKVTGLYRKLSGDFSFTIALTSQEKTKGACTGIMFSPSIEAFEKDELGFIGISPDMSMQLDVPPSMEKGLAKARSIIQRGEKKKFLDFPFWFRLVRKGDKFSGYYRLKGSEANSWVLFGEFTSNTGIGKDMLVGVFHHGSSRFEENTAMFDLSGRADAASFTDQNVPKKKRK